MEMNNYSLILPKWVSKEGEAGDVVLSSRVRLARNLKGFPFPNCANNQQLSEIGKTIESAVQIENCHAGHFNILRVKDIDSIERMMLVEKHLCSPQFIDEPEYKWLIVNEEQSISLMVNEEDHLRIQAMASGFAVDFSLDLANKIDDCLEESLEYCFDENCGYLTTCPTNLGTGVRVSLMLHLPCLTMVEQIKKVLSALNHVGINVRGLYGEGTESYGNIYQISNQITLGRSEEELAGHLKSVCRQVIEQERNVREALYKESRIQLEDRLCRSYGILTEARLLSSEEALKLLSDVKLGVELDMISTVDKVKLKELMFLSRAALLQKVTGQEIKSCERDYYRAQLIRDYLRKSE